MKTYAEALPPSDFWTSLVRNTCLRDVGGLSRGTLGEVLKNIDDSRSDDPLVGFVVIGCGKAFSIMKMQAGVIHFDSHQRTRSGEPGSTPTCVCVVAPNAVALLASLTLGGAYTKEDGYDLWQVSRADATDADAADRTIHTHMRVSCRCHFVVVQHVPSYDCFPCLFFYLDPMLSDVAVFRTLN